MKPFQVARKTTSGLEVIVNEDTRVVVQDDSVVNARRPEKPRQKRSALRGPEAERMLAKMSQRVVPLAKSTGPSKYVLAMARRNLDVREPNRMANRLVEASSVKFGRPSKLRR